MLTTIASNSGTPFNVETNLPLDTASITENLQDVDKIPSTNAVKNYVDISAQGISYVTVGKNDTTANFNTADYPTDWGAIVAAYNYATINKKKTVFVKNGVYNVNNGPRLLYVSDVSLIGESKEGVVIEGSRSYDWLLINLSGENYYSVDGFKIKNFTIDLLNGAFASGFRFYSTSNVTVEKCHFKNGSAGGWFVSWGSSNHEDQNNKGYNNQEIDCTYDTHQGSLEMVLVYNQDYYRSVRPTFLNKGTTVAGPVLGLWQNCKNPQIISPRFLDCNGYNYYSITCDNAYFENVYAENTGAVLQGANVSDNTVFGPRTGIDRVKGLVINGFTAIGGVNSRTSCALQLGAVEDFDVTVNHVEGYNQSVLFDRGNHQCYANSRRGRLKIGTLKNCNPNGTASAINPALFFNGAGKYDIVIEGGEVFDDQLVKTQLYPISFNEPHVEPTITFTVSSGVITGATVVNGGAGLPKNRSSVFPLVLNITGGTGAVVHAYTSWNGIVTSVVVINGGTGFTTPVVGSIVTDVYENVTVNNSRLVSYSGNPSVHKLSNATLANSIKFNDIREPTKGALSAYYYDLTTAHTHTARTDNPHNLTKAQIGLSNVDNTSDVNKPVSTATQTALALKANDSTVVHRSGSETITGAKVFQGSSNEQLTVVSTAIEISPGAFAHIMNINATDMPAFDFPNNTALRGFSNQYVDLTWRINTWNGIAEFRGLKLTNLPTSTFGLEAGDVWNDGGTLKIV